MGVREWIKTLIDWSFPRRCPVCHRPPHPPGYRICRDCMQKLSFVRGGICLKCGKSLFDRGDAICSDCRNLPKSFEYGFALLNYNEAASEAMSALKYRNKREYIEIFADLIVLRYGEEIKKMEADALIPVPLHRSRQRKRGFNQSALLAKRIGEALEIPVECGFLQRKKKTRAQKELDPKARLKNLSEAFTCEKLPTDLENLIIIDDIYTTGSTIEACTLALKAAGARKVYYLAVCIGQPLL